MSNIESTSQIRFLLKDHLNNEQENHTIHKNHQKQNYSSFQRKASNITFWII